MLTIPGNTFLFWISVKSWSYTVWKEVLQLSFEWKHSRKHSFVVTFCQNWTKVAFWLLKLNGRMTYSRFLHCQHHKLQFPEHTTAFKHGHFTLQSPESISVYSLTITRLLITHLHVYLQTTNAVLCFRFWNFKAFFSPSMLYWFWLFACWSIVWYIHVCFAWCFLFAHHLTLACVLTWTLPNDLNRSSLTFIKIGELHLHPSWLTVCEIHFLVKEAITLWMLLSPLYSYSLYTCFFHVTFYWSSTTSVASSSTTSFNNY